MTAGAAVQMQLVFERPFPNVLDVAQRLECLLGPTEPKVLVQQLVEDGGAVWRRPQTTVWWAEKGGDDRKAVFRLNIPPRPSYRKNSRVSLQYHVAARSLLVQTVKQNLLDYSVQWVAAFGPPGRTLSPAAAAVNGGGDDLGFLCR